MKKDFAVKAVLEVLQLLQQLQMKIEAIFVKITEILKLFSRAWNETQGYSSLLPDGFCYSVSYKNFSTSIISLI